MEERDEKEMFRIRMRRLSEKKKALKEIMNSEDLASLFEIPERMVVYYIQKGRIPAYRFGRGKYIISLKKLEEFVKDNSTYMNES